MRLLISLFIILNIFKSFTLADYQYGYCSIVPVSGVQDTFNGYVQIYADPDQTDQLTFKYNVNAVNLADKSYGVSINTFGYPTSDLGDVFNLDGMPAGCPSSDSSQYRMGDLNDIVIEQGKYADSVQYSKPKLSNIFSVIGRSLVFYNTSICPPKNTGAQNTDPRAIVATCVVGYPNTTVPENIPSGLTGVNTAAATTEDSSNAAVILYATNKAPSTSVTGHVVFNRVAGGVQILSSIKGLSKDAHGFHIHAFGQFSDDGTALGGHWAITGQNHSLPFDNSSNRHNGDLGNICSFDAKFENAYYNYTTNHFNFNDMYGHGFAVHATRDLGNSNVGGARILQGVVAIVNPSASPSNVSPSTTHFNFDNICENGAVDGETNNTGSSGSSNSTSSHSDSSNHGSSTSDSDGSSTSDSSSKFISSIFILGLFSSFALLF